jgi:predicted nucleic acid-binding protein
VTVIADTGALYAAFDRADAYHGVVSGYLRTLDQKPVVSPLVLAELDHLALVRLGEAARVEIMAELAETTFVATFTHAMFVTSADVAARHSDLALGLTDASIMMLAQEHGTRDILTTDQRHFRAVRPVLGGKDASYRLLPFDL